LNVVLDFRVYPHFFLVIFSVWRTGPGHRGEEWRYRHSGFTRRQSLHHCIWTEATFFNCSWV